MSRRQLLEIGLTPKAIEVRLTERRLLPVHRGVYTSGRRRLTRQGEWLAAVLAIGPGAVLSHRSAAALHGLLPERSRRVDVTSTTTSEELRALIAAPAESAQPTLPR